MIFEKGNLSRRGFMNRSIAGIAAAGVPLWYAKEVHASNIAAAQEQAAVEHKYNVGFIGIGSPQSRARALYGEFKRTKAMNCVAMCDVDARHLEKAKGWAKEDKFDDVKGHSDFRELLAQKNVDTVVIGTPDHWHAIIAVAALKAGKNVYCEKPLTLTIEEALALKKAVKETGKILMTGNQQRSEMHTKIGEQSVSKFRLAVEMVRAGRIGKVKRIECRINGNPVSGPIPAAAWPKELDWDMWCGPNPVVPFRLDAKKTNCHYEFRWWYEYSGGKMTDWGAHHIDIAQWALGMDGSGPKSVETVAASKPYDKEDGYNCHEHFNVKYTYANGAEVNVLSGDDNRKQDGPGYIKGVRGTDVKGLVRADGKPLMKKDPKDPMKMIPIEEVSGNENGVMIFGETGTIFVSRGELLASDAKIINEPLKDGLKLYENLPAFHMQNFVDCIKNNKTPICDVNVGAGSVMVCHLGVIALRSGLKLNWDPTANQFVGDNAEAGNKMISRPRRNGWKIS